MFLQQLPECSLTLLACLLPERRSRRRPQFGSPLLEKPAPVTAGQHRAFWCSTERLLLVRDCRAGTYHHQKSQAHPENAVLTQPAPGFTRHSLSRLNTTHHNATPLAALAAAKPFSRELSTTCMSVGTRELSAVFTAALTCASKAENTRKSRAVPGSCKLKSKRL